MNNSSDEIEFIKKDKMKASKVSENDSENVIF